MEQTITVTGHIEQPVSGVSHWRFASNLSVRLFWILRPFGSFCTPIKIGMASRFFTFGTVTPKCASYTFLHKGSSSEGPLSSPQRLSAVWQGDAQPHTRSPRTSVCSYLDPSGCRAPYFGATSLMGTKTSFQGTVTFFHLGRYF